MSNPSGQIAIEYEAETAGSLGENTSTFATHRLPVTNKIDLTGLKQSMIEPERVVQTLQGGTKKIRGPMGGSFKTKFWLTGHGSSTSGATTIDAIETFWKLAFGYATVVAASGTTATGGTATVPTTTASGTFAAGSVIPIGLGPVGATAGDGRGNGQFYAVDTHSLTDMTLLTDMDDDPAADDVIYSATNLYFPESPTDSANNITGWRGRILSGNLNVEVHGCYCTGIAISGLSTGEMPSIEFTWGVSWFDYTGSGSLPSSVTSNIYSPAPVTAGSFFINDVGTSTRTADTSKLKIRSFSLDLGMKTAALNAPGGFAQYQAVRDARRLGVDIKGRFTLDADSAATATPALDTKWKNQTSQHILYTLNSVAGSRVGLYFRNACPSGDRPMQFDQNGINTMPFEFMAYSGSTTTTPLTQSAMVLAHA